MTFPISPGVYGRETDKSVIVPSLATSVGAIVIQSNKGPVDEPTLITNNKQFVETFGEPLTDRPSMYAALSFLKQASRLYVTRVSTDAAIASVEVMDTQATPAKTFDINSANPGSWGNDIDIAFEDRDVGDGIFRIKVSYNGTLVETWTVSKTDGLLDGFGRSLYIEDVINGNSDYINVVDDTTTSELPDMTQELSLASGTNDTTAVADADVNTAWDMIANTNEYEVNYLINGGFDTEVVQTKMIGIAEGRGDAIAILDMPITETTVADMVTYRDTALGANSTFAAIYAGWPQIYDQYNDKQVFVPPSGEVAGAYAYSARVSEPWSAPAGTNRGRLNVVGINKIFTEGERDTLYEAEINPIQLFRGDGVVIWGQKTLTSTPSARQSVNVRLLLNTIQKEIARALRPFVFEANDAFTRANISSLLRNYMDDVQARRGVTDYYVVADTSNNTEQQIDNNQLIVDLHIKPTRTAEYIRLNTIVTATGVEFAE